MGEVWVYVFYLFLFFLKGYEDNLALGIGFLKVGCVWNLFLRCRPQDVSWGWLSFAEPQAFGIEVPVSKSDQVEVPENVHKAAALFQAHLGSWGQPEPLGKLASGAVRWSGMCLSKQERAWVSLLSPLKPHTNTVSRLIPSGSTVHCWGCLGAMMQHSQEGGLSWDPQRQGKLNKVE